MDIIGNQNLKRKDGSELALNEALGDKKVVCFYFSAHWCPPCRAFTPTLKMFYDDVKDLGIEIIFVSSDRSADDMMSYFKNDHGDWFAVEHGTAETQSLKQKYSIAGIPTLVVVKRDGTLITKEGRGQVQTKGPAAAQEWLALAN